MDNYHVIHTLLDDHLAYWLYTKREEVVGFQLV